MPILFVQNIYFIFIQIFLCTFASYFGCVFSYPFGEMSKIAVDFWPKVDGKQQFDGNYRKAMVWLWY